MRNKRFTTKSLIKKSLCLVLFFIFAIQFTFVPVMISNGITFAPGTDFTREDPSYVSFNDKKTGVTVSGFITSSGNQYAFYDALSFTFDEPDESYFNRFTIEYSADACIQGTIYYKVDSNTKTETFFIESGENVSFSSLIDGYLDSEVAHSITKIKFKALSALTANITIKSVNTVTYNVFKDETAYIENDRFKLGCCLIWGGGLNYIEDKKDNDPTVTNMLNHCDTGRLVQQSYYGTMDYPYVTGYYNGSQWAYNPVQGGDQYGNKSKLVDFSMNENTIYVKCRPLDWSKNNQYTFSYMENVYTLEDDCIKVDNRFIDFSDYDHGSSGKHQELPAFYTISYLDTFTFYNGSNPWTGDKLTVKKNLPFWGESQNQSKCYFNIARENTETWCAWTSSEKGYGLGLYTPDVSILLAGRHAYNGSKNPADGATNYVAPLITTIMQNYEPFQYSYYITGGTVDSIRSTFSEKKINQSLPDLANDTTNLSFDSENEITAFGGENEVAISYSESYGAMVYNVPAWSKDGSGKCDSYAYVNFSSNVNTKAYRYLVLSYMLPTKNAESDYIAEFFICSGDRAEAEGGYSHREYMIADGKFHSMIIDMWQTIALNGTALWPSKGEVLNCIRLDFDGASPNDKLYISGFGLTGSKADADAYAAEYLKMPDRTEISGDASQNDSIIVIPTFAPNATSGVAVSPDTPTTSPTNTPTVPPTNTPIVTPTQTPTASPSEGTPTSPPNTATPSSDDSGQTLSPTPSATLSSAADDSDDNDSAIKDNDKEDETNIVFIIGMIAIGVLVIAAAVILTVVVVKKKKASKKDDSDSFDKIQK